MFSIRAHCLKFKSSFKEVAEEVLKGTAFCSLSWKTVSACKLPCSFAFWPDTPCGVLLKRRTFFFFFFNGHPKAGRENSIFTRQGIPPGGICERGKKNAGVKRQASLCWETWPRKHEALLVSRKPWPPLRAAERAGPLVFFPETQGSLASGCVYQHQLRLRLMLLPSLGSLPISRGLWSLHADWFPSNLPDAAEYCRHHPSSHKKTVCIL